MQKQKLTWNTDAAFDLEIKPARPSSTLPNAVFKPGHRRLRIALPLPRRESCLTKRAMLAALREAELAEWQASGGDLLRSSQYHPSLSPN